MVRRMVVALGGNAILTDDPTAKAQEKALETIPEFNPSISSSRSSETK